MQQTNHKVLQETPSHLDGGEDDHVMARPTRPVDLAELSVDPVDQLLGLVQGEVAALPQLQLAARKIRLT